MEHGGRFSKKFFSFSGFGGYHNFQWSKNLLSFSMNILTCKVGYQLDLIDLDSKTIEHKCIRLIIYLLFFSVDITYYIIPWAKNKYGKPCFKKKVHQP